LGDCFFDERFELGTRKAESTTQSKIQNPKSKIAAPLFAYQPGMMLKPYTMSSTGRWWGFVA
jgi:hypothetical protein